MGGTKKLDRNLRITENVVFVFAFGFIMYNLLSTYGQYIYNSIKGKGYIGAIIDPFFSNQYYISAVSIIIILNTTCLLWEILSLIVQLFKQTRGGKPGYKKYKSIFKSISVNYKPSFLALLINQLLPKLILLHMFWIWMPHFQKLGLFSASLKWYGWTYGYLCWEFSAWVFHFTCHRVRVLWCLHSPHHAPSELNMTVNWVHFFAETYYSTLIHLGVSMFLGVNPVMFAAFLAIDSAWGIFVHISERALQNGRLGVLQHLIITPAHHRAHHAKNPLYLDTNFAVALPIWDWVFGTLQPLKDEVRADYGVSRELDVTNFSDLYFGEIVLLYQDMKNADGIKNKLLYLLKPPGWSPDSVSKTASAVRRDFLKTNSALAVTSRSRLLSAIKSCFKVHKLEPGFYTEGPQLPEVADLELQAEAQTEISNVI